MNPTSHLLGFHAITARLRQHAMSIREIYVSSARNDRRARELIDRAQVAGVSVHSVDERRLDALAGSDKHQGVVALVDASVPKRSLDEILNDATEPLFLLLDGVTDPHNLGACVRSADAFGADAVIVPKDRAAGLTPIAAKAASGAAENIPLITVTNLARTMRELKQRNVWVIGADPAGKESLFDIDLSGPLAWVLGAEGSGLRRLTRDICDRVVAIPLLGNVASLNVSVATGICLYETRRQQSVGRSATLK